MTRAYPVPQTTNTLHCIGDLHAGGITTARKQIMLTDMAGPRMPSVATHLQLGDMANYGAGSEYTEALAFMDALGGDWYAVVGNHDMYSGAGTRTAAEAAADIGLSAASYTIDLDYAVLIALGPTAIDPGDRASLTFDGSWLDQQLTTYAGRTCLVAAHAPLFETVGVGDPSTDWRSTDTGFYTVNDADLRAVLADHDNAKAWLSAHTHSPLTARDLVKPETVGGHTMAMVNTSALYFTGRTVEWTDRVATVFVTVEDDRIDVRFRDHGSHQWVGGSADQQRVWSVDTAA